MGKLEAVHFEGRTFRAILCFILLFDFDLIREDFWPETVNLSVVNKFLFDGCIKNYETRIAIGIML